MGELANTVACSCGVKRFLLKTGLVASLLQGGAAMHPDGQKPGLIGPGLSPSNSYSLPPAHTGPVHLYIRSS